MAEICACKSEILSFCRRDSENSSLVYLSKNLLFFTISNFSMATPSYERDFEKGGILPGVIPPISAWCPLEATYKFFPSPIWKHVMIVKSGRWDPPAWGWLDKITSPALIPLLIC